MEVRDPSGAPVAASGRLQNLTTGVDQAFETSIAGTYTLESVAFGRYRLTVSHPGFATQNADIDVQSATPITQTVTLELGTSSFSMNVVAVTPLQGVDRTLDEIPAPVQVANDRDVEASGALDLADFMNKRLSGVFLNEVQGNPVQPDLNYRGYTASPLLGTPQGVSIFMDGVRLNQSFGDVVSWDLIPRIAISEIAVIPGSNPLFGLNTLGGAISLQTKDGRSHPGTALELSGGSFGRRMANLENGGSIKSFSWYGAANLLFEDGWRPASSSNVRQFFGKLGWQGTRTVAGLGLGFANNQLNGNGMQESRLLASDYSSVYTKPDVTGSRAPSATLNLRHSVNDRLTIAGNFYYRYIRTKTFNGDINENSLDQSMYQPGAAERAALAQAGYPNVPASGLTAANTPFPFLRCIGNALLRDEPGEKCNGLINQTRALQRNYGVSGQANWITGTDARRNQLTVGAAFDGNNVHFQQGSELGYLNPDHSITGVRAFGDGVTGGNVDGEPYDTRVNLRGKINTGSFYLMDTVNLDSKWTFTLSGRYNHTSVDNFDRIRPQGTGTLTAKHTFDRFNPSVGVTYRTMRLASVYFNYGEGTRAPTSIELGCADPNLPCKLPNAMAGDPPLKQVVARTVETGIHSGSESALHWTAGYFRSDTRDDILFVSSPQTGFGYFKNFGKTLRQGVELDARIQVKRVTTGVGYTFLDATFRSPEIVNGSGNSSNAEALAGRKGLESTISISPGNRMPMIPQHMLKAYVDIPILSRLFFDLNVVAISSSFARGNENNQHQPDGAVFLGQGSTPAYGIVNLGARYQVRSRFELFVRVNNLFDRKYYTASQLGPTGFTATGTYLARPLPAINGEFPVIQSTFLAPGAPINAQAGLKVRF